MVWPRFKAPLIGFWLNSFRLFWLFSKRWTTNRITLNNTQYSKLFNYRIILPRSDLDSNIHIKEVDQSPNAERIAAPFCSEHMIKKFKKMSWTVWKQEVQVLLPPAACRLLVGEIWRWRKDSHFDTWDEVSSRIQSSPRNPLKDWKKLLWFFVWSFDNEGVTDEKNVTCNDTCINTL